VAECNLARGEALDVLVEAPIVQTKQYDGVPTLDVSSSYEVETGQGAIFLVNRSQTDAIVTDLIWQNGKTFLVDKAWQLSGSDPKESNTWDQPNRVVTNPISAPTIRGNRAMVQLPPLSFTAITFCRE
jgi:alpha-N-arabinofuranosidase